LSVDCRIGPCQLDRLYWSSQRWQQGVSC